jgi:hypothetical protein
MLADIVTGWLNLPCRDWRLSCDARLDAKRASVVEVRLVAGTLQREDWDGSEDDLGIQEMHLDVDRARVSLDGRCLATLSLHAIARRLQRHPDGSIESLLHDIGLIATAARGALVAGGGYKIRTEADGGGWRGRAIVQVDKGQRQTALAVRTWLDR